MVAFRREAIITGPRRIVYPKKYAHGFWFAVLCCGYTLTDFPISIRLPSLALWQSHDCPRASKATLMNMDKYFMWIYYERLHNHNKAKHNKPCAYFLGYTVLVETLLTETSDRAPIPLAWTSLKLMHCMLLRARHTFDISVFDLQYNVYLSHYGHVRFRWCFSSGPVKGKYMFR